MTTIDDTFLDAKNYLDFKLKTKKPEEIETVVLYKVFGNFAHINRYKINDYTSTYSIKFPGKPRLFLSNDDVKESLLPFCKEYARNPDNFFG